MNLSQLHIKISTTISQVLDFTKTNWLRIPANWRYEVMSAVSTFFSAAFSEMLLQYQATHYALPTSLTAIAAILTPALRLGVKAVVNLIRTRLLNMPRVQSLLSDQNEQS